MQSSVAKVCVVQCSHVVGDVNSVKDTLFLELVITRGYEMRETTVEGQNAFAPTLCFVVLCGSFTSRMVKPRVIRLRVFEGQNARDPFHSFLVEVQTKAGYIHATHA